MHLLKRAIHKLPLLLLFVGTISCISEPDCEVSYGPDHIPLMGFELLDKNTSEDLLKAGVIDSSKIIVINDQDTLPRDYVYLANGNLALIFGQTGSTGENHYTIYQDTTKLFAYQFVLQLHPDPCHHYLKPQEQLPLDCDWDIGQGFRIFF